MKKIFVIIVMALCSILTISCEKIANTDMPKTGDDLVGTYRLVKIEDVFVLDGETIRNTVYEYKDDGWHDIIRWVFNWGGEMYIHYSELNWTGERGHYVENEKPHKCFYRVEKQELMVFDGPDAEKYRIEEFVGGGNIYCHLNLSQEYGYIRKGERVATVKRTFYLLGEISDNFTYF